MCLLLSCWSIINGGLAVSKAVLAILALLLRLLGFGLWASGFYLIYVAGWGDLEVAGYVKGLFFFTPGVMLVSLGWNVFFRGPRDLYKWAGRNTSTDPPQHAN
jgi:hypothetical protein